MELLKYVNTDIQEVLPYIKYGIIVGILTALICLLLSKKDSKHTAPFRSRILLIFLFSTYICVVLIIALFSREPGSRNAIDLIPFSTWSLSPVGQAYVIENILMFIPFGLFIALLSPRMHHLRYCLLAGFIVSLSIETIQLITECGYFQVDDLLTNVLGTAIGWLIWKISQKAFTTQ